MKNDNNAIICKTAHRTVNGVDCKCRAQYNVPTSVDKYDTVKIRLSGVNNDFM